MNEADINVVDINETDINAADINAADRISPSHFRPAQDCPEAILHARGQDGGRGQRRFLRLSRRLESQD